MAGNPEVGPGQRRAWLSRQRRIQLAYLVDRKNDDPEQFRAIGWSGGRLCSVIFEIRHDSEGEDYRLITAWKATEKEEQSYAENI